VHSNVNTFGAQLRHFARSVDIVDDEVFELVRKLMYRYVRKELGVTYFEVMRDQLIDNEPGLKMFWSIEDRDHLWRISQPDGSPTNLVTRAFAEQRAMWVVGDVRGVAGAHRSARVHGLAQHQHFGEHQRPDRPGDHAGQLRNLLPLRALPREAGVHGQSERGVRAGMLHARTADAILGGSVDGGGWIPLREAASPPVPFDFAADRTIIVPRFPDGSLNEDRLHEALRRRVESLLIKA
jgi:hypothetical protein